MHVLAIILARAGSVRLPRKNLARLGGCSLVAHAAFAAMLKRPCEMEAHLVKGAA